MTIHKYSSYIVIVLLLTGAKASLAQNLELKDLNIPNSPAFTILDYSPAVIDRPGTAKTFAASVVSLVSQSSGLPKNFALEVAPFWLFKNNLNAYSYLGINPGTNRQTNVFSNVRNASISIGSVYRDSSKAHPFNANYIAAGIRVNLINIVRRQMIGALHTTVDAIAARQVKLLKPATAGCIAKLTPGTPECNACIAKAVADSISKDDVMNVEEERLHSLLAIKPLFAVDLAGAGSWGYKDNSYNSKQGYRTGIWGTLAFSYPLQGNTDIEKMIANKNYVNVYATGRYMSEDSTADFKTFINQHLLDIGGRFELEFNKFSMSFETIHRINQLASKLNTNRNVGILQYKINDKLFLSGTFGKNFGSVNNLIALFGVNWGLGKQSIIE